jgi:hypothetical protein
MMKQHSRRAILRGGVALAGLGVLGFPDWALPVLAQDETLVPFTNKKTFLEDNSQFPRKVMVS